MDRIPKFPREDPSADHSTDATSSALCDFLVLIRADEGEGSIRRLSQYLAFFPGHELEIAREFLARLEGTPPSSSSAPKEPGDLDRYELGPIIGQGGMGEVVLAHDNRLDRELAVKLLRRPGERAKLRFLREVHITGSLDHPGIVPVHDLGVDATGHPFFAMKHVEGIDLDKVIDQVHRGGADWSLARAIEVLIKVCDTMAFAHSRGIVHRDLKPSNVRVGRFGEVYVMDWGLALVMSEGQSCAERDDGGGETNLAPADSNSLTLDGDVLGTPAYMAPEQAEGVKGTVGRAVDVYAVGAMLYQLLSGKRPFGSDGRRRSHDEVLKLLRRKAPQPLRVVAAGAPRELVAICEKAMHREPLRRYAEMESVGRDLRAFLDRRLVSAYDTSLLERAVKWTRRNRSFAISVMAVVLVASSAAALVRHNRLEGRQRLVQLSRGQLVAGFDTLWPPDPSNEATLVSWLESAQEVLATRAQDLASLAELKRHALPLDPDAPAERAERARLAERVRQRGSLIRHYERLLEQIERGERLAPDGTSREWVAEQVTGNRAQLERDVLEQPRHLTFRFEDDGDRILFEGLTRLVSEQENMLGTDRAFGLVEMARWGLAATRRVAELSLDRPRLDWERARRSIADRSECPSYDGLDLSPQLGLAPMGRDPRSGLWEFAHVLTGEIPERNPDGSLRIDEHSAVVLVLIPGGTLLRGSQREDPSRPNFDPWSEDNAPQTGDVELEPFFLSRYELTQAQWRRVTGRKPHEHTEYVIPWTPSPLFPIEDVNFGDATRFLLVVGLALPTEAQWEWAQRAGTDTPWSCGVVPEAIAGYANIANVAGDQLGYLADDGFEICAPVGSLLPNGFGLHDMMGNVREWCRDTGPFEYRHGLTQIETGERVYMDDGTRAVRGGSFALSVLRCRSAARDQVGPSLHATDLGIRPARDIDR